MQLSCQPPSVSAPLEEVLISLGTVIQLEQLLVKQLWLICELDGLLPAGLTVGEQEQINQVIWDSLKEGYVTPLEGREVSSSHNRMLLQGRAPQETAL